MGAKRSAWASGAVALSTANSRSPSNNATEQNLSELSIHKMSGSIIAAP
jgi:hypothetical protein